MRFPFRKSFFLVAVLSLWIPMTAQQNDALPMDSGTQEERISVTRHEVFSYDSADVALRLPKGAHLLVISGPMDTYMLGHLRDAMIANRKATFSLDLSAVSAFFDMDKEAFNGCKNLISIIIPDGAMRVRWQCFSGCENLIAINATENCDAFASSAGILYDKTGSEVVVCPPGWDGAVELPLSVSSVRSGAFANCSKVTAFSLATRTEEYQQDGKILERVIENEYFSVRDGILYSKDMKRLVQFPGGKSGRVTIPNTVEVIGRESFAYGGRVTAVEIPESVRTIEKMAFGYCSALQSVIFPAGIISIGKQAFVWCTSLGAVTIPASVTYLGSRAFFKSSVTAVAFEDADGWTFGKKILVDLTNPSENAEKFRHPGKYWFLDLYKAER
ncbi:MAG: leucine-rich repeat protein [Treponema sp.]|nr:leucine-rich repeat protein [Treponema sp.]